MRTWLYILAFCATLGLQAHAWAHEFSDQDSSTAHGEVCLACKLGQNSATPTLERVQCPLIKTPGHWLAEQPLASPVSRHRTVYQSRAPPHNVSSLAS